MNSFLTQEFRDLGSVPNAGGYLTCRETKLLRVF